MANNNSDSTAIGIARDQQLLRGNLVYLKKNSQNKEEYAAAIAVCDLVLALVEFKHSDSNSTDVDAAKIIIQESMQSLHSFMKKIKESSGGSKNDIQNRATALTEFKQASSQTLTQNFRYLATEYTFSNEIKSLFNSACKLVGLKPPYKLNPTEIFKAEIIAAKFKALDQHPGLKIKEKDEVRISEAGPSKTFKQ